MSMFITVIRFVAAAVAIWQILGLLPALTWLSNPSAITTHMWVILMIKSFVLAVCGGIYFLMGKVKKHREVKNGSTEG